jgi:plasmid stability protein
MSGITIRNLDPAIKERLRVRHNQGLRGHADECLMLEPGVAGEVCFVNRLFRLAA